MDRTIRRALYTTLVAGGLVVVGASPASAMVDGASNPDGVAGQHGIVESLLHADVGAVVEGTLGKDGVLDELLVGGRPPEADAPVPENPVIENPVPVAPVPETSPPEAPVPETPVPDVPATDPPTEAPASDRPGGLIDGIIGSGREPADRPGTSKPGKDRPASDRPKPRPVGSGPDQPDAHVIGVEALDVDGPVRARTDAVDRFVADADPAIAPATGVDLRWGARDGVVLTSSGATADDLAEPVYDARILMSGLYDGMHGTSTGSSERAVTERSEESLAQTGPMTTVHLALASLLLGLGVAVLRTRRRPPVV